MPGWLSEPAARASIWKRRSRSASHSRPAGSTLIATSRPRRGVGGRGTPPPPPPPRRAVACGGHCPQWALGLRCNSSSDCGSGACGAGRCVPPPPALAFDPMMVFPTGRGPLHLGALDLDGDGATDLVTLDESGATVSVLL